jgi:hypothetical protein
MHTISSLTQYKMASESIGPFCTSLATIRADGDGVPISFPLGSDGLASVSAVHLGLRFQLNIASCTLTRKFLIQYLVMFLILLVRFQCVMEMASTSC